MTPERIKKLRYAGEGWSDDDIVIAADFSGRLVDRLTWGELRALLAAHGKVTRTVEAEDEKYCQDCGGTPANCETTDGVDLCRECYLQVPVWKHTDLEEDNDAARGKTCEWVREDWANFKGDQFRTSCGRVLHTRHDRTRPCWCGGRVVIRDGGTT